MANIKCRYRIPYCEYHNEHERLFHNEFWWCDHNDWCAIGKYSKHPQDAIVNGQCIYCQYENGEFEKTVKNYEYINGELKIGNKKYTYHDIIYLEIDGRVLIEEDS